MIKSIILKFGHHQNQQSLKFDVTPITVFVGPNNSGKSKVLVEIENFCRRTTGQPNDVILRQLEFEPLTRGVYCNFDNVAYDSKKLFG